MTSEKLAQYLLEKLLEDIQLNDVNTSSQYNFNNQLINL